MSAGTSVYLHSSLIRQLRPTRSFSLATCPRSLSGGRGAVWYIGFSSHLRRAVLQPGRSCRLICQNKSRCGKSAVDTEHAGEESAGCGSPEDAASIYNTIQLDKAFSKFNDKWIPAIVFTIVLLWKHDMGSLWAGIGTPVNYNISVALKHTFNHKRPALGKKSDPGMPSSHSQSYFYTSTYLIFYLIQWLGVDGLTILGAFIIFAISSYLSSFRVAEKFHTTDQVLVGAILGSVNAAIWECLWYSFAQALLVSSIWARTLLFFATTIYYVFFFEDVYKSLSNKSMVKS